MRMILKLIALPMLLVVILLSLIGKGLTHISSYVFGLLFLVLAGCGIYCVVQGQWMNLAILSGMAVAAFLALFLLVWFEVTADSIGKRLGAFMRA